jgi:hypothetical protein
MVLNASLITLIVRLALAVRVRRWVPVHGYRCRCGIASGRSSPAREVRVSFPVSCGHCGLISSAVNSEVRLLMIMLTGSGMNAFLHIWCHHLYWRQTTSDGRRDDSNSRTASVL